MPSYGEDHTTAVAFFTGMQQDVEFWIPTRTEDEARDLAAKFQQMFCRMLQRYEQLEGSYDNQEEESNQKERDTEYQSSGISA